MCDMEIYVYSICNWRSNQLVFYTFARVKVSLNKTPKPVVVRSCMCISPTAVSPLGSIKCIVIVEMWFPRTDEGFQACFENNKGEFEDMFPSAEAFWNFDNNNIDN